MPNESSFTNSDCNPTFDKSLMEILFLIKKYLKLYSRIPFDVKNY